MMSFIMMSCEKETSSPSSSADTQTSFLTAKEWKLISLVHSNDTTPEHEIIEECQKDDIEVFTTSGYYLSKTGGKACNDEQPNSIDTMRWQFNPSKTVIYAYWNSLENKIDLKINTLSSNELVLELSEANGSDKTVATYTH